MIHYKNISKWFGDFQVLKNINLEILSGEKIVICGPSGSGKSTLIRLINALESYEEGELLVDGVIVDSLMPNIEKYRSQIGMVFQHFNLFPHLSIIDNLILAPMKVKHMPKSEAINIAHHYLDVVGILDQKDKYPSALSGGQKQRVAIARAMCMKPKVMLFDEPTSALDPEVVQEVLESMEKLADEGQTLLIVTHEMGFAKKIADKVIFMDQGEIVEISSPDVFFTNPKTTRAQKFLNAII